MHPTTTPSPAAHYRTERETQAAYDLAGRLVLEWVGIVGPDGSVYSYVPANDPHLPTLLAVLNGNEAARRELA